MSYCLRIIPGSKYKKGICINLFLKRQNFKLICIIIYDFKLLKSITFLGDKNQEEIVLTMGYWKIDFINYFS